MSDYLFYKDSEFEKLLQNETKGFKYVVQNDLDNILQSVLNMEEPFLSNFIKAFGLSNITTLIANGMLFNKALENTITFEGFCNLLESIFNSRNIDLVFDNFNEISITVENKNGALLKFYKDSLEDIYTDNQPFAYTGLEIGAWDDINGFLTRFLSQFLPAGRKIKELILI